MDPKLNSVLLIDDNSDDNFFHARIIRKYDIAKEIIVKESAEEGLDYLGAAGRGELSIPDLIFLDINMPGMNGWDFLDRYCLIERFRESCIVILTTSENPDDMERAGEYNCVSDFQTKPLNREKVEEIITKYFNRS